jgi:NTP pyrophosphatase (non-canonical NTP hydrolase)
MMNRYLDVLDYFGYRNQMKKLHEEVFELNEAIDNYEDYLAFGDRGNKDEISYNAQLVFRDGIIEELGDILSLCTQFIGKYEVSPEELNDIMDFKLERTERRIKEGYYEEKR